jgi:alkanesulfonate monooxygenase
VTTPANRPLRFHWSLSQAGKTLRRGTRRDQMSGVPDFGAQLALCRCAEEQGIESMLMAISYTRPDPLLLAVALGLQTATLKFMVACRAGLLSPVAFVQQVNTAAAVLPGRICVNLVAGHTPQELGYYGSFLSHDERFAQTDEFLAIWRNAGPVDFQGRYYQVEGCRVGTPFVGMPFVGATAAAPEIFVGGNSERAAELGMRHAACLWRFPEPVDELRPRIAPVVAHGTEVGLIASLVARPTREAALRHAESLPAQAGSEAREVHRQLERATDSVAFSSTYRRAGDAGSAWLSPTLWTGAVPYFGPPAIAFVGSTEEIVATLLEYRAIGISQFLFLGWPDLEEMTFFGAEVLPRLRRAEARCL